MISNLVSKETVVIRWSYRCQGRSYMKRLEISANWTDFYLDGFSESYATLSNIDVRRILSGKPVGYRVKRAGGCITVGCQRFPKRIVDQVRKALKQ